MDTLVRDSRWRMQAGSMQTLRSGKQLRLDGLTELKTGYAVTNSQSHLAADDSGLRISETQRCWRDVACMTFYFMYIV
jgi:hypothetical protein